MFYLLIPCVCYYMLSWYASLNDFIIESWLVFFPPLNKEESIVARCLYNYYIVSFSFKIIWEAGGVGQECTNGLKIIILLPDFALYSMGTRPLMTHSTLYKNKTPSYPLYFFQWQPLFILWWEKIPSYFNWILKC